MFLRLLSLLALIAALTACDAVDTMKDGFAHSQAVSATLEKELGLKSFVGFNWNNGLLTSVNVTFQGLPKDKTLDAIAEKSRQAIVQEFKQKPRQIIIAFSLAP
ncbi:MAG: hypothetical protein LBG66_06215 [Gallionellaceae bacterium]|jgi:hypothetical protein|nr:hypothetical protein [Gallionellaceae bacterium]